MKTLEDFNFEKIEGRSILGGYGTTYDGNTATCSPGGCNDDGSDSD